MAPREERREIGYCEPQESTRPRHRYRASSTTRASPQSGARERSTARAARREVYVVPEARYRRT